MSGQALVDGYLARLETAARTLPPGRGAELVGEVREHIEAALAKAGVDDEVSVRNVLERLGSPDEIVVAERDPGEVGRRGEGEPTPEVEETPRRGRLTMTRVVIVMVGAAVIILLAFMTLSVGISAAVYAIAVAILTPYVWVPLLVGLSVVALRRDRAPLESAAAGLAGSTATGNQAWRRPAPGLVGLVAIVGLLLVALVAQGPMYMGLVAALAAPVIVLLLVLEVVRDRRR